VAPRYASLDVLKASAIITIVWIHSFLNFFEQASATVQRLGFLARYGVPAFLFASGFLAQRGSARSLRGFLPARLVRIVVPYIIASAAAIAFRRGVYGESVPVSQMMFELLTGSAWSIYYFVPMLVGALFLAWVIARYRVPVVPLFVILWIFGLLSELGLARLDLYWSFRNPLRWWGYFVAGWIAAGYQQRIDVLTTARRRRLAAGIAAVTAGLFGYYICFLPPVGGSATVILGYLVIYGLVLAIFLWPWEVHESGTIRWLSEATYPIYLYHCFFIEVAWRWMVAASLPRHAPAFVAGMVGSISLVYAARRVMGRRARVLLG
jgi:surface polysaccharide O-acyltransferase-like enzyme